MVAFLVYIFPFGFDKIFDVLVLSEYWLLSMLKKIRFVGIKQHGMGLIGFVNEVL